MAELIAAGSSRVVEIVREGGRVVECQAGATSTRGFASVGDALVAYRARVGELVQDGWRLIGCDEDLSRPVAWDPAIEAALLADPDPALLAVYGDWLIDHGDPCGELAVLRAGTRTKEIAEAIRVLERDRADELFRGFAVAYDARDVVLTWSQGWVETITCDAYSGTRFTLALNAPISRFVRGLAFLHPRVGVMRAALAASSRRHQIRRLAVHDPHRVQELLDCLPALSEVAMPSGAQTPVGHPAVQKLLISVAAAPECHVLGAWPALEELAIDVADPSVLGRSAGRLVLTGDSLPVLDGRTYRLNVTTTGQ